MNEWDKWILEKYYTQLFKNARWLVRKFQLSCEPEDIIDDAYLKITGVKDFRDFENDKKRMNYFKEIMKSTAIDLARKSKRTPRHPLPQEESTAVDNDIVEQIEKEEMRRRIVEKLKRIAKRMPPAQREIFEIITQRRIEREIIEALVEIFEGGKKSSLRSELYIEIRERLGISESNLYKRMERIKKIIKREFEEDPELTGFL